MILLRSIYRPRDATLEWPPPDSGSWPDAVIVDDPSRTEAIRASGTQVIATSVPTADAAAYVDGVALAAASESEVREADGRLGQAEATAGLERGAIGLHLLVETARQVLAVRQAAAAGERVVSVIADVEALRADLGVPASREVDALAFPRGEVLLAASLARRLPIGRFEAAGHHREPAGDRTASEYSFAMGFRGGLCANWDEVREANAGFAPDAAGMVRARRVLEAMREATEQGLGAISLDGRMIDLPFIRAAEQLVALGEAAEARRERIEAARDP